MRAKVINLFERSDRMEQFKQNNLPFKYSRFNAIRSDPGWLGCTQSHLMALRESIAPVMILEDDCLFLESWDVVLQAIRQLPRNWDALWLGGTLMKAQKRYSENLFHADEILCAHAIIFKTNRIIDYVIHNFDSYQTDMRKTIDVFYAYDVQQKFNCFITYPLVATQRSGYSDIEKQNVNYTQIVELYKAHTDVST